MNASSDTIILIPARLAATRLPNKPLADLHGEPMIVHVWRRAMEARLGRVVVAAGDREIVEAIEAVGGEAVLTPADLASGTDRIYAALQLIDPEGSHQMIVNVQGDLPTLDPRLIRQACDALGEADMSTLVAEISEPSECDNPNVVKAVLAAPTHDSGAYRRALYFSRANVPTGSAPRYHHIGLYVYSRAALDRFVALSPSPLEKSEKLEQLRALEDGFVIHAAIADTVPLGVDAAEDLEKAREMLASSSRGL
jgi:3-deoxy-manno-octulosonate cytidylyltransferase (CMP-KDO synthetase)